MSKRRLPGVIFIIGIFSVVVGFELGKEIVDPILAAFAPASPMSHVILLVFVGCIVMLSGWYLWRKIPTAIDERLSLGLTAAATIALMLSALGSGIIARAILSLIVPGIPGASR